MVSIESIKKRKGRPNLCKFCGEQFSFLSNDDHALWVEKRFPCPKCGSPYCNKSKTEINLFRIQDEFYDTGDINKLSDLFQEFVPYARSLTLEVLKKSVFNEEDLMDYAISASTLVIEEYFFKRCRKCNRKVSLDKPEFTICKCTDREIKDFKINLSFSSYIVFKLKQVIYHPSNKDIGGYSVTNADGEVEEFEALSLDYDFDSMSDTLQFQMKSNYSSLTEIENKITKEQILQRIQNSILIQNNPVKSFLNSTLLLLLLKRGEKNFNLIMNRLGHKELIYQGSKIVNKVRNELVDE